MRIVTRLGPFAGETTVVHVGDRGADLFPFFLACQATHPAFLVRVCEHRRVEPDGEPHQSVVEPIRALGVQASRPFSVPGTHGRTARQTDVRLSFGSIRVMPPRWETRCGTESLSLWAIRVGEEDTPADEEPWEWLLVTSVPPTTIEQA